MLRRARLSNRGAARVLSLVLAMTPWAGVGAETTPTVVQAILRGDNLLLETTLKGGSSPEAVREDGTTALMLAALHGDAEAVEILLAAGADPKAANEDGATALHWGAGDAEKVHHLLERGADPNARSELDRSPLQVAAAHPEGGASVKLLLDAGADGDQLALLYNAADAGSLESIELLLGAGARKGLDRALSAAAGRGFLEVAQRLVEAGANPDANPGGSGSALNGALLGEHLGTAHFLLDHGASLGKETRNGDSSLMLSVYNEGGDDSILRAILAKEEVDLQAANKRGETAATWAHKRGHTRLVELLGKQGAPDGPLPDHKEVPVREVVMTAENRQFLLRSAASKSLSLMLHSSEVFLKNRESCVSCHHQNIPSMAFGLAEERGFELNQAAITALVARQQQDWGRRSKRAYQLKDPVPVPPRFIGWGILGWAALGYQPDELTEAMVWYLRETQQSDGRWANDLLRPPMGGNEFTGTALALRSIQLYPPPGSRARSERAVARAREWLMGKRPDTLQERLSHLLGLTWSGAPPEVVTEWAEAILTLQRSDGGWAQLPGLPSDAWATGQALYALANAGALRPGQPAYESGLHFLLKTQFDDGSWYVASRSWPFQPHFDSGFPHGRDQWISVGGTAWATIAMLLAIDPLDEATAAQLAAEHSISESPDRLIGNLEDLPRGVDFAADIKPLLERSCVKCHSADKPKGSFRVTDRESLLKGGESGHAAIEPGKPAESQILEVVSDRIEDLEMPPLGKRDRYPAFTAEEVRRLAGWILKGASWPEGVSVQVPAE